MNLLRGLLFDNLGLKLVALLLAVLVYLNVYTDRPTTMIVSFPIQFTDLADSLSLSGSAPATIQAEMRGTGKQFIRLRLTEPPIKFSLAGVGRGHYRRSLELDNLPMPSGVDMKLERLVSPDTLELNVDRKGWRHLPVAARIEGMPAGGVAWGGGAAVSPAIVEVSGPVGVIAALDSIVLATLSIAGKRDTVRAELGAQDLPDWCVMKPEQVSVSVSLEPVSTRRIVIPIESPRGVSGYTVSPERVTVTVSAPRSALTAHALEDVHVYWTAPQPVAEFLGRRVALHRSGAFPTDARVRFDPDSVTLVRAKQ
jgi:hypothetical protein